MDEKYLQRGLLAILGVALAGFVLSACGASMETPAPTETFTATSTFTPSLTPSWTSTSSPTPEPALPENLGGDPRYAAEIQKYDWSYNEGKTQILVDWESNGNFELAARLVNSEWRVDQNCKFVYIPNGAEKITGTETLPFSRESQGEGKNRHLGIIRGYPNSAFVDFISTGKITQSPRYDIETGAQLPGQIFYIEAFTQKNDGTPMQFNIVVAVNMGDSENILALGDGDPDNNGIYDIFYYANKFGPGKKMTVRFVVEGPTKGSYFDFIRPSFDDSKRFIETGTPPAIIFPSPPFVRL